MFSCGSSSIAKFFLRKAEHDTPTKLNCFNKLIIKKICIFQDLAIILLNDGSVHSFGNDENILGHPPNTSKVGAFEAIQVVNVTVGRGHFFAIDENGKVFGWGYNVNGELGWKENISYKSPKLVKAIQPHRISMVSCGEEHSLFLGCNGCVWSSGKNEFGQLGFESTDIVSAEIQPLSSLLGIPFQQVSAGSFHSFALSVSGTMFGWGRNDDGQLGLGDTKNRFVPALLKSIRAQFVKYISAGKCHTVILTDDGRVFAFGLNSSGQLGHGSPASCDDKQSSVVMIPKQVFELMGNVVTQIACGDYHTLTFVPASGQIYGFGSNKYGQLGQDQMKKKSINEFLPRRFVGPWTPAALQANPMYNRLSTFVKDIYAGGAESLVVTSSEVQSSDFRETPKRQQLFTLNDDLIAKLEKLAADSRIPLDLKRYFETVIGSSACLNGSFLDGGHFRTSSQYHGVNIMSVRLLFSKLNQCSCNELKALMSTTVQNHLIPSLPDNPPDIEALRIFLFLPECWLFDDKDMFSAVAIPFARKCNSLPGGASKVLNNWYFTLEPIYFLRQVNIYLNSIKHLLSRQLHYDNESQLYLKSALDFLKNLNTVNSSAEIQLIPYRKFYLPEIARLINLEDDYIRWYSRNMQSVTFCSYPFLLNSNAKTSLLQIDATWQMRAAYSQAQDRRVASLFGMGTHFGEEPILEIEVRRQELVKDALTTLAHVDMQSLKKPLVVKFHGEEGQDAGGVRKEFFMLILKEITDPKYGMFRYFEESRLIWFSDFKLEDDVMYFLVGLVCGLAIYNSTIIDLCFPLALYKKLLGEKVFLSDMAELNPIVGKNLKLLLEYTDHDQGTIEDVFCLDFTIALDYFGEVQTIELVPGGSKVAVTEKNRSEYVERYLDFVFNKSVLKQFEAFSKGFLKVCDGHILQLFRPMELMEMVVGNQNYNWEEFEKQASYKGEYYRNHPTINLFWQVFHNFTLDEKKEFLLFLTGCNRVPINGLKITIQPMRTTVDHLPIAHTCFNILDLPMYKSSSKMEQKLKQAMLNNQGFHLA